MTTSRISIPLNVLEQIGTSISQYGKPLSCTSVNGTEYYSEKETFSTSSTYIGLKLPYSTIRTYISFYFPSTKYNVSSFFVRVGLASSIYYKGTGCGATYDSGYTSGTCRILSNGVTLASGNLASDRSVNLEGSAITFTSSGYDLNFTLEYKPPKSSYVVARLQFAYVDLYVNYEDTCAISAPTVTASPTSLDKPGVIRFSASGSECSDSSCGSVESYSYSVTSPDGTITSGTSSFVDIGTDEGAGTYTCTFTASGCGGKTASNSVSCTLADMEAYPSYRIKSTDDWIDTTSGSSISFRGGIRSIQLKWHNSYCGASGYNSYVYRVYDGDEELIASTDTNVDLIIPVTFQNTGWYYFGFRFGSTAESSVLDSYINIYIPEMEESGKIGETSSPSTDVTSGVLYPYTSGGAKIIYFRYNNNYGSGDVPLRILVNNVEIANSTETYVTGSYTFTSSKSVTVSYAYGDASSPTVGIEFAVSVDGIVSGTGVIEINGTPITSTSSNPVVSTYYENSLSLIGLSGYDNTATFTWSLTSPSSSSDYVLVQNGSTATLKCLNPNVQYRVKCVVTSYGTNVPTDMYGKYITCVSKTIALFDITPAEGEPETTHFIIEGADAIAPTPSSYVTVKYKWEILDEFEAQIPSTYYHTVSGGGVTDDNWEFYMTVPGTFRVKLSADTTGTAYTSYQIGTDLETIVVNKVIPFNQPVQNRYSIILYNDTYTSIVNRTNSNVLFMDLNFSSGLNSIGKCSFQIVGGNNLKCGGVSSSESLLKTGTKVIVVDNLCPIWMGKITTINNVNINYYQAYTNTTIVNVECDEIVKELSYQYIPPEDAKTVSGVLEDIVKDYIIPEENHGTFGTSSISYAISLSTSSRLTALDSLSSQVGWRYRVRPNVTAFCNTITISSGTITVEDSSLLRVNDLIIIYDGETKDSAGMYHAAVVTGIASGNHITISRASETLPNGIYHFTNYRGFLVDYRPAYYQDYVPLELNINECAQNVDSTSVAADKFGEVSVFGVGNSGETISSNMRAWMKINPNYTIDNTARISKSYDSTIDTINTLGEAVLDGYTWTRFAITVNGWSFPSGPTINTHRPTIFYKNKNGEVMVMELRSISSVIIPETDIVKFVDQSSTEKTQFIASFISAKADGSPLQPSDSRYADYADSEGRKYVDILSSMPALTNVVFNYMTITSDKVLANIFPVAGGKIMIGDTEVILTSLSPTGNLTFDWILTENGSPVKVAPHGHLTDVLVIDNTGTKHNSQGYRYGRPDPDSPYGKYGDVTISIQGAEGYSRMELERLACRYMQYGSNYSDRGSCQVVLNAFIKSDYDIGCRKILTPGDRFVLNKVTSSSGSSTISTALNYELLSYNVSLNSNMVTVSFGMPFVELNDVIYNMLSNAGMSIMASSSDINL